jgi:hypothetical protein
VSSDQDHGSPHQSMTCESAASSAIHRIKIVAASRIPSAFLFLGSDHAPFHGCLHVFIHNHRFSLQNAW